MQVILSVSVNWSEVLRGILAIGSVMLFMTLFSLALIADEMRH